MFSFVVLPDFQAYCDLRLKITQKVFKIPDQRERMFQQLQWVSENARALNTAMVFQEGDLTQTNDEAEWALTESAMRWLDPVVPYLLCVGNHDMGYEEKPPPGRFWVSNRRDSLVDRYFPPARFQQSPLYQYGGNLNGSSENYFLFFEAEGLRFLALSLEFMPRDEAIAWANQVIAAHPDRRVVVLTHGYLDCRGKRNLRGEMYPLVGNDAQAIWDKLLQRHANIFLVLSGHEYGEARRTDLGLHGNEVHQVMANYQWWENGGMGWLRVMQFHPAENRIDVKTFSPVLNRFRKAPSSEFSLTYVMTDDPSRFAGLTPLQQRKLRHFFVLFDADGSGSIDADDFLVIRDRFANMLGVDTDTPRYVRMGQALLALWHGYLVDKTAIALTMRGFLQHWSDNALAVARGGAGRDAVLAEIHGFVGMMLEVVDANGDGTIGAIELLLFLKAVGVDHGALAIFKKLDQNGDGGLSADELRAHAEGFFLGTDEHSPSNELFGPLDH